MAPPYALPTIPAINPALPPWQPRDPNHEVQMLDSQPSRESSMGGASHIKHITISRERGFYLFCE